ncbi:MAG: SDR family oxidoreductase [Candidatus Brocadiales bacterium]
METILITGGTGFLGSSLVRRLARGDYRLILLVRNRDILEGGGLEKLLAEEGDGARVPSGSIKVVKGDITLPCLGLDSKEFSKLAGEVDTILHCAALTDFGNRDALMHTNVTGTKHILDFAVIQRLKRYHHISSAYVVGKGMSHGGKISNAREFNNAYEETKFIGESLVNKYASFFQLPATIYRPSTIIGNSRSGYTKVFKGMYSFAKALHSVSRYVRNESFRIFGDSEATVNLVPIDYVSDSILAIADNKRSIKKTFNITNPNPPTLFQLNTKIANALGIKAPEIVPLTNQFTLNSLERLYLSYMRPYLPYAQNKLYFDFSNTQELLAETDIVCPRISQRLISLLINFAIADNWGNKAEKREPALAGADRCRDRRYLKGLHT